MVKKAKKAKKTWHFSFWTTPLDRNSNFIHRYVFFYEKSVSRCFSWTLFSILNKQVRLHMSVFQQAVEVAVHTYMCTLIYNFACARYLVLYWLIKYLNKVHRNQSYVEQLQQNLISLANSFLTYDNLTIKGQVSLVPYIEAI